MSTEIFLDEIVLDLVQIKSAMIITSGTQRVAGILPAIEGETPSTRRDDYEEKEDSFSGYCLGFDAVRLKMLGP
jgi:hypothetical protein